MIFNLKETYILENEIVRLEPLSMNHFDDLVDFSINTQDYNILSQKQKKRVPKF